MIDPINPMGLVAPGGVGDVSPARPTVGAVEAPGADFSSMLGDLFANTAGALKTAEAASISGMTGKASVQQVVEAVMNAEQSLQGAIAVRDKVVGAYLEISRMQI